MVSLHHEFDTFFPNFDDIETLLDADLLELGDSADDEEFRVTSANSLNQEKKYISKEDEDVATFISIFDQMSVQSVLFLMQNHARDMLGIPEVELRQAWLAEKRTTISGNIFLPLSKSSLVEQKNQRPPKKFRFAEILGGTQIREQVFSIIQLLEYTAEEKMATWWSKNELQRMKMRAGKLVRHYKAHRLDFIECCEMLALSSQMEGKDEQSKQQSVESHIKCFARDSAVRGLEMHICAKLKDFRYNSIRMALDQQDLAFENRRIMEGQKNDNISNNNKLLPQEVAEQEWESMAHIYRESSAPSVCLAALKAQADHMQAFKALLSTWRKPIETADPRHQREACIMDAEPGPFLGGRSLSCLAHPATEDAAQVV